MTKNVVCLSIIIFSNIYSVYLGHGRVFLFIQPADIWHSFQWRLRKFHVNDRLFVIIVSSHDFARANDGPRSKNSKGRRDLSVHISLFWNIHALQFWAYNLLHFYFNPYNLFLVSCSLYHGVLCCRVITHRQHEKSSKEVYSVFINDSCLCQCFPNLRHLQYS